MNVHFQIFALEDYSQFVRFSNVIYLKQKVCNTRRYSHGSKRMNICPITSIGLLWRDSSSFLQIKMVSYPI